MWLYAEAVVKLRVRAVRAWVVGCAGAGVGGIWSSPAVRVRKGADLVRSSGDRMLTGHGANNRADNGGRSSTMVRWARVQTWW